MTTTQPTILQTVAWRRRERVTEHVALSHVADYYRRYPGEQVIFHTRLDMLVDVSHLSLSIDVPAGMRVVHLATPEALENPVAGVEQIGESERITWSIDQAIAKGARWEFELQTDILHDVAQGDVDVHYDCNVEISVTTATGEHSEASTTTSVAVAPKGRYLKYLPSIYREDELMTRFLMLFESFWAPIEDQITQIPYYFDPKITPVRLLPWLASWADLNLDERWSEAKQRLLIRNIVSLYRRRGTRSGLEQMLELYTGVKPQILEHRANNLRLGDGARLGPSIALGKGNVPHTFTITLRLPPVQGVNGAALSKDEATRREAERRRVIESIIESGKPAHTQFTLELEQA